MINQINIPFYNGTCMMLDREVKDSNAQAEDVFIHSQADSSLPKEMMTRAGSASPGVSLDKAAESLLTKKEPSPPSPPLLSDLWGITSDTLADHSSYCVGPDGAIHFKTSGGVLLSVKDGNALLHIRMNKGCDPSVACGPDGTLYTGTVWVDHSTMDTKGSLIAMKDGKRLWDFQAHDAVRYPAVVGNDGSVYVGDESGYLYSLKYGPKLGGLLKGVKTQWSVKMSAGPSAPLSSGPDGAIYMATSPTKTYEEQANRLHAVKDGKELWNVKLDKRIYTKPAIGPDGTVYVRCEDDKLYAIKDGKISWNFPTGFSRENSLCIGPDGTIYFGDRNNKVCAVKDGKVLWEFKPSGYDMFEAAPCIGKDGTVYAGGINGTVYAIKNGILQWYSNPSGSEAIRTLIMNQDSNVLHILNRKGDLLALQITDTANSEISKNAQEIKKKSDDGKDVIPKPGIDQSVDGWVIIDGVKVPKK